MVSRINLYVAFVFSGILFVVDAYPEKRHGKKIQFLACISMSFYKLLDLRAYFAMNMNSLPINLKKRRGICTKFGGKIGSFTSYFSYRHSLSVCRPTEFVNFFSIFVQICEMNFVWRPNIPKLIFLNGFRDPSLSPKSNVNNCIWLYK